MGARPATCGAKARRFLFLACAGRNGAPRGKSRAETRKLQRENQVLRQNAAAAMRAPVRGVGGGGDTKQEPDDPFLMGFNDEKW